MSRCSVALITAVVAVAVAVMVFADGAEASPGCKRITAGFNWRGRNFLFFRNDYVSLDTNYVQNGTGDVYTDWGVPWPDAAVVWSVDHADYYFSNKFYFSPWSDFAPVDSFRFGQFFKDGLDAAGNIDGISYFFEGCKMVKSLVGRFSDPLPLPEGLPCEVDAALTAGKNLLVFKDDQMWVVEPSGVQSDMPVATSSKITLHGITLCKEGETE